MEILSINNKTISLDQILNLMSYFYGYEKSIDFELFFHILIDFFYLFEIKDVRSEK